MSNANLCVVTNPEFGWGCIVGVYVSKNEAVCNVAADLKIDNWMLTTVNDLEKKISKEYGPYHFHEISLEGHSVITDKEMEYYEAVDYVGSNVPCFGEMVDDYLADD
jgi:hypothetical protein